MYRRITGQDNNLGVRIYMLFSELGMRVFHERREAPREAPPARREVARRRPDPSALDLELRFAV